MEENKGFDKYEDAEYKSVQRGKTVYKYYKRLNVLKLNGVNLFITCPPCVNSTFK